MNITMKGLNFCVLVFWTKVALALEGLNKVGVLQAPSTSYHLVRLQRLPFLEYSERHDL